MTSHKLDQIERVVQMKYMIQRHELAKLAVRENGIRGQLAQLSEHVRSSEIDVFSPMRSIGADVIWKSWVGRKKSQLNMQLAQILAQKEHHLRQVRKAYGKVLVTDQLSSLEAQALQKQRTDAELEAAIRMALYH